MAATTRQNGYVTWANFLVIVGLVLTVAVAFNTFAWSQHAIFLQQFEKRMDGQFLNIEKRLDRIDLKLEK